jgi:threonine synthase
MDWEIAANRNGHIACTHGGESLAGLVSARKQGIIDGSDVAVIDSTAHALKFAGFQEMYFEQRFPPEFNIEPNPELINAPVYVRPDDLESIPAPGRPLRGEELNQFVTRTAEAIAGILGLRKKI